MEATKAGDRSLDAEIRVLLDVLPERIRKKLLRIPDAEDLVEIILDLGRHPEARTYTGEAVLEQLEVTEDDLDAVIRKVGEFGDDNRAGIPRTLHRISAIRSRNGRIIGLTLRIGRAVYGTVEPVRDVVEGGQSILLLGRPGVGKTTMLRETARILAERRRVIVVDTSNEIAGDGDIPHPAIGRARRMQVATPTLQHEVMIEAVENHNPEVIIIDEIGRELEATAARTIAERGVQLVATAHGNTLQNLLQNPTLSDLVGGLESVTLSDEEARRRGTQKSVLERRAPPTFGVVVEIKTFDRLAIHHEVTAAVDSLLRGRPLEPELRYRNDDGELVTEPGSQPAFTMQIEGFTRSRSRAGSAGNAGNAGHAGHAGDTPPVAAPARPAPLAPIQVYAYGVSQNRLRQTAKALGVPVIISDELTTASALLTLKSYYRRRPAVIGEAEMRQIPVYVLRSNTSTQIEHALQDLFQLAPVGDAVDRAVSEAGDAIREILVDGREMVELGPQTAPLRRRQHEMAREANLLSLSRGREPQRRVRIFRNTHG